jgi:hypothetical protein
MFYRFKREKIKTSFELNGYSNVEETKYLVEESGRALSRQESVALSCKNTFSCVTKASIRVALELINERLFTLELVIQVFSYTSYCNLGNISLLLRLYRRRLHCIDLMLVA